MAKAMPFFLWDLLAKACKGGEDRPTVQAYACLQEARKPYCAEQGGKQECIVLSGKAAITRLA